MHHARKVSLDVALWLAVLLWATWFGGTLYQMLVIVPIWGAAPPQSLQAFFLGTDYNRTIFNFFGPPFIVARTLPILAALALGWALPRHRRWLVLAAGCHLFVIAFTVIHIYPINAVLFARAGAGLGDSEVRALARHWILVDRLRFAVGAVEFWALLRAFRLPGGE